MHFHQQVMLAHDIGHVSSSSLSSDSNVLIYGAYENSNLGNDKIQGIQFIYVIKTSSRKTSMTSMTPTNSKKLSTTPPVTTETTVRMHWTHLSLFTVHMSSY